VARLFTAFDRRALLFKLKFRHREIKNPGTACRGYTNLRRRVSEISATMKGSQQYRKIFWQQFPGIHSNRKYVILVNHPRNLAPPYRSTAQVIWISVSLGHNYIAWNQH
jgi:hypothetical protein